MAYKVAVVGATGNVGREMLSVVAERNFPVDEMHRRWRRSARPGTEVSFGDDDVLKVEDLDKFDFKGIDIALSSPGAKVSADAQSARRQGRRVVIDNTSHFRMDPDVPLVVPEVNPQAIAGYTKKGIIANPELLDHPDGRGTEAAARPGARSSASSSRPTSRCRAPARRRWTNCSTRRAASTSTTRSKPERFTKQIAFNVIPHIDVFMDDGSTKEEWKMVVETKKILDPDIAVHATCVRVPVFIGHAEAVNVEFERPIDRSRGAQGAAEFRQASSSSIIAPMKAMSPRPKCAGEDPVYVSRIRKDPTVPNGLRCGWSPTICAKARRSTPCRSPKCWCAIICPAKPRRRRRKRRTDRHVRPRDCWAAPAPLGSLSSRQQRARA